MVFAVGCHCRLFRHEGLGLGCFELVRGAGLLGGLALSFLHYLASLEHVRKSL